MRIDLSKSVVVIEPDTTPTSLGLAQDNNSTKMVWVISPCCRAEINGRNKFEVSCANCDRLILRLETKMPGSRAVYVDYLVDPETGPAWMSAWLGYSADDLKAIRL